MNSQDSKISSLKKFILIPDSENKNQSITYKDIIYFSISNKNNNDYYNKKRENIIAAIINDEINNYYYKYSLRWKKLKNQIKLFLKKLFKENNIQKANTIECKEKGGRKNHFDFIITINNEIKINLELKFNIESIIQAPQFVSPMKPSQYLDLNFEVFYYDYYLIKIANFGKLKIPNKEVYLKTIHNNNVECMKPFKKKYDSDIEFNKYCKNIDKEAIKNFILISNIDLIKLSNYLINSQKKKIYMCYSNGRFYYDSINADNYKIKKLVKRENTNFIVETYTSMNIEIKIRFKNGCGLQFPAFQIKRKIPKIKQLKNICKKNNIVPPKLKKDILQILDKHNIIY